VTGVNAHATEFADNGHLHESWGGPRGSRSTPPPGGSPGQAGTNANKLHQLVVAESHAAVRHTVITIEKAMGTIKRYLQLTIAMAAKQRARAHSAAHDRQSLCRKANQARTMTARFGADANPLADARGCDPSRDREERFQKKKCLVQSTSMCNAADDRIVDALRNTAP